MKNRFNLWVSDADHHKVVCHGAREEMIALALLADVDDGTLFHVLPDGQEPTSTPQKDQ